MKIAAAFLMICVVCFLIVWNIPRPNFSDYKGFPVLGQTIKGKFYPNPEQNDELTKLGEMILDSAGKKNLTITLDEDNYLNFAGNGFVFCVSYRGVK